MANNVPNIAFTDIVNNDDTTGYFNELMASIKGHINAEYQAGRIIGNDYANVFLGSMQYAMNNAIQYALQKHVQDQQAELIAAQTANTIAEGANIPKQGLLLDSQKDKLDADKLLTDQQKLNLKAEALNIPKQGLLIDAQKDSQVAQTTLASAQTTLTTSKNTTEIKQQTVLDKQATLYVNQAKAFEGKHNKELLKILTDTWVVSESESLPDSNASTAFGENINTLIGTAKWSSLTTS